MVAIIMMTAFVVSVDAMAAGFALAMRGALTRKTVLTVGVITLLLCLPAALGGELLSDIFQDNINLFGGALLVAIGARNLSHAVFPPLIRPRMQSSLQADAVTVGVAVGLDAAVANLSLSLMGQHSLMIPVIFAAMHILAVSIGTLVLTFLPKTRLLEVGSALLLSGIGFYKFLAVLFTI